VIEITKADKCYFCSETECLEEHHIVPKRYEGSDCDENLVQVCPTCHRKLERIYNERFYENLGRHNQIKGKDLLEDKRDELVEHLLYSEISERVKGFIAALNWVSNKNRNDDYSPPWSEEKSLIVYCGNCGLTQHESENENQKCKDCKSRSLSVRAVVQK